MSLVTYPSLNKSTPFSRVSEEGERHAKSGVTSTFVNRLRKALATAGRLFSSMHTAIAEARLQKAIIEAELYGKRYIYTSKNDDDLPVVLPRRHTSDLSSAVRTVRTNGQGITSRKRAQTVLVAFALFAAVFAAIIALRVVVWLPAFRH